MTEQEFLLAEQKIKALAEPIIIKLIKDKDQQLQQISNSKLHIISRGGDAINYYLFNTDIIPTHDWDLGISEIGGDSLDNHFTENDFNFIKKFVNSFLEEAKKRLDRYFSKQEIINYLRSNNIVITDWKNFLSQGRLSNIVYTYTYNDIIRQNALIDIYITSYFVNVPNVVNDNHYKRNITKEIYENALNKVGGATTSDKETILRSFIKNEKVLYYNTFNLIVQDADTGMKYVAPGDLMTDTMRMIYQSLENINIATGNNKYFKYAIKYSNLLKVINSMYGLCQNSSCLKISAEIIQRNTSEVDCRGNKIIEKLKFKNSIIAEIKNIVKIDDFNSLSIKKLCEIGKILKM